MRIMRAKCIMCGHSLTLVDERPIMVECPYCQERIFVAGSCRANLESGFRLYVLGTIIECIALVTLMVLGIIQYGTI